MNKKQIDKLVLASFTKGNLDAEKIDEIANYLDRSEIKEYIKALKKWKDETTVFITLPDSPKKEDEERFSHLFPDKKIVYNINPGILVGVRIRNNDVITEFDLKDTLEDMVNYVSNI